MVLKTGVLQYACSTSKISQLKWLKQQLFSCRFLWGNIGLNEGTKFDKNSSKN
jgi:hypothetical protein